MAQSGKDVERNKSDVGQRIDRGLSENLSFLWGAVRPASRSGVYALYLRCKQGGIWVAVAKRTLPDNPAAEVAFGQGRTVGSALHALSVNMSQGKWKRDMPWTGSE